MRKLPVVIVNVLANAHSTSSTSSIAGYFEALRVYEQATAVF